MSDFHEELEERLDALRAGGLYRSLCPPTGVDFASNDYLGLGADAGLCQRVIDSWDGGPMAAPASRLLRGTTAAHEALERRLARFKGTESALLFSTGYQANLGVITALVGPEDRIVSDELNHASIIDAVRLSRAHKRIVPHLDVGAIERTLATPHAGGRTFVVTESLFSMDGDIAPLDAYADLCDRYDAQLVVDDAHATGVFGDERGSGLTETYGVERRALAVTSTFGKALGAFGAFVGAADTVVRYLVNRARPFVFTTAPPPLLLAVVNAALDVVEREPERRALIRDRAGRLRDALTERGMARLPGSGPIVPVIVGDADRAMAVADRIQRAGFDVRAIRPPTVPEGTCRLRISVHADHTADQIDALADSVAAAVAEPVGAVHGP